MTVADRTRSRSVFEDRAQPHATLAQRLRRLRIGRTDRYRQVEAGVTDRG